VFLLGDGKPRCSWCFFNDELKRRVAENTLQRAKLAKDSDTFLCGYGEGTQAIGAGDYVVFAVAGDPYRCSVLLNRRPWRSVAQQLRNLCEQLLEPKRFDKEGICEHAQRFDRRLKFSAYGNGWDLRESPPDNLEKLEA
jgi:hypothetical protein